MWPGLIAFEYIYKIKGAAVNLYASPFIHSFGFRHKMNFHFEILCVQLFGIHFRIEHNNIYWIWLSLIIQRTETIILFSSSKWENTMGSQRNECTFNLIIHKCPHTLVNIFCIFFPLWMAAHCCYHFEECFVGSGGQHRS